MLRYSPIILFIYARPDHTRRTLEALSSNTLAQESDLFIYADGPKENATEEQRERIRQTREVARSRQWCRSCINIDPLPSCINRFKRLRPSDINLNIGISDKTGEMEYYDFEEPAFNTTNPVRAEHILKNGYTKLKEKTTIKIDTLKNVLDSYLGAREIDLLTIDVETMELSVLKSNDWDKYRPKFIIMESIVNARESLDNIYTDPAVKFLIDLRYIAVAKVSNAVFLKSES